MSDIRHWRALRHLAQASRLVSPASAIQRAREISRGNLKLQRAGLKVDDLQAHRDGLLAEDLHELAWGLEYGTVAVDTDEFMRHLEALTWNRSKVSGPVLRSWLELAREGLED